MFGPCIRLSVLRYARQWKHKKWERSHKFFIVGEGHLVCACEHWTLYIDFVIQNYDFPFNKNPFRWRHPIHRTAQMEFGQHVSHTISIINRIRIVVYSSRICLFLFFSFGECAWLLWSFIFIIFFFHFFEQRATVLFLYSGHSARGRKYIYIYKMNVWIFIMFFAAYFFSVLSEIRT